MKNLISAVGFLLISAVSVCQVVNIPDANFKNVLLAHIDINTNSDSEIQVSEAVEFYDFLDVSGYDISDLTGIEAFTNLPGLYCSDNYLTSLDISANIYLEALRISHNQLTSLDVSSNPDIIELVCSNNQLTNIDVTNNLNLDYLDIKGNYISSLDISGNSYLRYVICSDNQLTSLDFSANPNIIHLKCLNNELTSLDLRNGNNTDIDEFSVKYNPDLLCILVDNAAWSIANWTAPNEIDSTAGFAESEICNVGINNPASSPFQLFPNPATTHLTLTTPTTAQTDYTLYDLSGRALHSGSFMQNTTITINDFAAGAYFVELRSEEGSSRQKFIKQ